MNNHTNKNPLEFNQITNIDYNINLYNNDIQIINNRIDIENDNIQIINNRIDIVDDNIQALNNRININNQHIVLNQDIDDNIQNVVNNIINIVNGLNVIPQYTHIMPNPTVRNVSPNEHNDIFNRINLSNLPVFINTIGNNSVYVFNSPRFGYLMLRITDFNNMQYEVYQINLNQIHNWINVIA